MTRDELYTANRAAITAAVAALDPIEQAKLKGDLEVMLADGTHNDVIVLTYYRAMGVPGPQ